MKKYLHAFAMTQSMFCAIPCPWHIWDEAARPLMPLFLPVVGLEIGLLWRGLAWFAEALNWPVLIAGLILCAYPYLITGFLHLDGFMDVTDAVGSCRNPEERQRILKDPHVGSFAVAGCVLLLLAGFALFSSGRGNSWTLLFIPAVSRCCSALAVTLLRPISVSQYAGTFRQERPKGQPWVLCGILGALLTAGFLFCGIYGAALPAVMAGHALALCRGVRALGGMNGDISGYALTIGELCGVVVYVLI